MSSTQSNASLSHAPTSQLSTNPRKTNLVWVDLEMTGLDVNNDKIIEIATIVTDKDLNVVAYGPVFAIGISQEDLESMSPTVRQMHTDNGLIQRCLASKTTLADAERLTLEFIKQHVDQGCSPLCGNSIGTDKMFMVQYMPKIISYLHYRMIDVSSIKVLNQLWNLGTQYQKNSTHLALDDIKESINELKFYRDTILKR